MKYTQLLLLGTLLLGGCSSRQNQQIAPDHRVLTEGVVAKEQKVLLTESFMSEIRPFKENDLTPAAAGVHIDRILVDVGDAVHQGDVVVRLDPTQYNQQRLQLQRLEDDYNRLQPVFEAGGISRQMIDQAQSQRDIQREVVENLRRNIELRSPISGVVTARNYESGDLFAQQPILHIMQIDPLKVEVNISEQYFRQVHKGMAVRLVVEIFPDEVFEGRVRLIYPQLDATTRTFKVEVEVKNQHRKLHPGMYARALFDMGEKQGVMVPDVAICKQMGSAERFVFVLQGDTVAVRRRVEVGRQVGELVDVVSGVERGEKVAVTALSKLYDGVSVRLE